MSFVTQTRTKRLLAVHGWTGTLLGLLLYVCIFTGSIVVFENEIDRWAQGQIAHHEGIGTRVDHHFRVAAREVDRAYYEEVRIFRMANADMRYVFHTHKTDPETGQIVEPTVRITVDHETGDVIDRWEGLRPEQPSEPGGALRDFWVDLHVQLYLPNPYGIVLVGVLGLAMMFAAISGIMIHRHVLRDVFVAARNPARLVGARDLHVLAGTWGLPFAFILAFTGAFFGFAGNFGVPIMSQAAFGGDQDAMIEALIGQPEGTDLTSKPTAALDFVIREGMERTGAVVNSIFIANYDSASARIVLNMDPSPGSLAPQRLAFDGVSRSFESTQPIIGLTPSVGGSLLGIIGPLHFGNFAGLASKLVWLGMGLAMAFVTATGLLLWTKRREEETLWRGFRRGVMITVWGLPFAMLVSAVAFFLTLPVGDPHFSTPLGFLLGAVIAIILGLRGAVVEEQLRLGNAALCIGMPLLRHLTGGASWSEALIGGGAEILVIDLLLILMGLALLRKARKTALDAGPTAIQEPAE